MKEQFAAYEQDVYEAGKGDYAEPKGQSIDLTAIHISAALREKVPNGLSRCRCQPSQHYL